MTWKSVRVFWGQFLFLIGTISSCSSINDSFNGWFWTLQRNLLILASALLSVLAAVLKNEPPNIVASLNSEEQKVVGSVVVKTLAWRMKGR